MLEAVLIGYFIEQFSVPKTFDPPVQTKFNYRQLVYPEGDITVNAQAKRINSVPRGSQGVSMLNLSASASCDASVTLNSLTVQRKGLGANQDIEQLYVTHLGQRISSARPISQGNGRATFNLRRFQVPACTEQVLEVLADFSVDAAITGQHQLELISVEADNATVRIDRRQVDPVFQTVPARVGRISVEYLDVNERVRYGSRQRVARFTLEADNESDHMISSIQFTNNGSASDDDLQNLYVEFRNRRVSDIAPAMIGDTVIIPFTPPLLLSKNQTLKFSVRADVRASRSRTIQLLIEEPSDITAEPYRNRN